MIFSPEESALLNRLREGAISGRETQLLAIIDRQLEEIDFLARIAAREQFELWRTLLAEALAIWIKEKLIAETKAKAAASSPLTDAERTSIACAKVASSAETNTLVEIIERLTGVVIPAADSE